MSAVRDMPAPWRAWAHSQRDACPDAAVLCALSARLGQVYRLVGPDGGASTMAAAQRLRLRRLYLRTPADFRRVRRYVVQHAHGVSSTLRAAESDRAAAGLLGPEVLLILERLHDDPFGLRAAWPDDASVRALLALADANARPFAD